MSWKNLTKKQQKKFGGNKKNYKQAKKQVKSSGGNVQKAKNVVKQYKRSNPAPSPSPSSNNNKKRRSNNNSRPAPVAQKPSANKRSPGVAKKVSNINNYDTTSYGSGNHKKADKLSQADIKELTRQGFSDKEVVKYVEDKWSSGTKGGLKAKNLLNKYKERLTTPASVVQASKPALVAAAPPTQGRTEEIKNKITPDMYQSSNSGKSTTTEGSSNTNNVTIGGGKGKGKISINQSNTQTFETVQDNDIVTSVTGNDNKVNNTQDNSVKNYGGAQNNNATVGGSGKSKSFINKEYAPGYGERIGAPAGTVFSADFKDRDGDGIDDRTQPGPGMPKPGKGINLGTGNRNVGVGQGNDQGFKTTQDNDIVTTVTGDNNTVTNWQDNSIRNYGGDQRNFTYIGGKNPLLDTPASAATMAGFYDVDDSPSAQAKFVDMYTTMNRDNQKARRGMTPSIANEMIAKANKLPGFSHQELDKVNRRSSQIARDRATNRALGIFGDRYKAQVPNWNSPERQMGIEQPDYDKLYDKYTSF